MRDDTIHQRNISNTAGLFAKQHYHELLWKWEFREPLTLLTLTIDQSFKTSMKSDIE